MMGTLKISGIEVDADALHDTLRVLVEPPAGHRVLEHQEDRGQLAWTLDSGWTDPERIDGEPLLWSAPIACGALADGAPVPWAQGERSRWRRARLRLRRDAVVDAADERDGAGVDAAPRRARERGRAMMSEQKISDERLAEIEARASAATRGPWSALRKDVLCHGTPEGDWVVACDVVGEGDAEFIAAARTDVPDLVADLRAARAEIKRYRETSIRQAVLDMGPAWACSACGYIYRGQLKKKCPECGRQDYFSGSVRVDALAKYDAEQAAIIRARGDAACAKRRKPTQVAPGVVCATCNDTHEMELHHPYDDTATRMVMCTRCPMPCQECGGGGPYCKTTPCACGCHMKRGDR